MDHREQLIELREKAGLTQAEMAALIGMSLRGYQELEAGKVAFQLIHANAMWMVSIMLANKREDIRLAPPPVRNAAIELASKITGRSYGADDAEIPSGKPEALSGEKQLADTPLGTLPTEVAQAVAVLVEHLKKSNQMRMDVELFDVRLKGYDYGKITVQVTRQR